jgi:hypothetical protein
VKQLKSWPPQADRLGRNFATAEVDPAAKGWMHNVTFRTVTALLNVSSIDACSASKTHQLVLRWINVARIRAMQSS